jgi:cobalt-zinc-cadmium efflux system membrane fusion protein
MNIKLKIYYFIFFYSSFFLLNACGNKESNKKPEDSIEVNENKLTLTEIQFKNAKIELTTLASKQMPTLLKLNGKIDVPPQNMVSISVPLGGYLKTTSLLPGMHVNKGQVIAQMEDQQYIQMQEDYLTALNTLDLNRKEYNRQKELNQSKAVSDKVYQQAESAYKGQEIIVNSLREKLKLININPNHLQSGAISRRINIYSPIDGFVSNVKVNIGKYINPSEVLFELVNPSDIHLNLTVYEKDIQSLQIGQQVIAFTNNDTTTKHPCEIILIGKDLSSDRSVEVHCHFLDYDKTLLPGMYMNAEIEMSSNLTNVVPEEAVVRFETKSYVFVETGTRIYEMKEVSIGQNHAGQIEVFSPELTSQQKIVSKGAYTLLMSLKNKSEE